MVYNYYNIMKSLLIIISCFLYSAKCALEYIMVGDYGWTFDMTVPKLNFDGLNAYVGNLTAKGGHIDFIMTMGDNMYLANEVYPT
jgi:hypothetical protein